MMKEELEAVKKTDNHEAALEKIQKKLRVHLLFGMEKNERDFSSLRVGGHLNYMGPISTRTSCWSCSIFKATEYSFKF